MILSGISEFMKEHLVLVVKNPPTNARDVRDTGSIPELGGSPGGGHDNPLQHSCLENPTDRGAWRATAHGVAKSRTGWKHPSTHALGTKIPQAAQHSQKQRPAGRWWRLKARGVGGNEETWRDSGIFLKRQNPQDLVIRS